VLPRDSATLGGVRHSVVVYVTYFHKFDWNAVKAMRVLQKFPTYSR
jgi:hypothetical protein